MKIKTCSILSLAIGAMALMCVTGHAATFTAVTTGNWSVGATWGNPGNVVGTDFPGAADDAIIGTGITVSVVAAGAAVNNIAVDNGGTFNINANNALPILTINGSITNNGTWSLGVNSGNSTAVVYAGSGSVIAGTGTITNQIATFTGSYTIQPGASITAGNRNPGINHLLGGAGSLVNLGTIIYNSGDQGSSVANNPDIASLDSSAVGSTFVLIWSNVANGHNLVRALTFHNFVYDSNNGTGCNLSGVTINGDITFDTLLNVNAGSATAWPSINSIGGKIIYKTGGTAAVFPDGFSITGLNQSAGTLVVANGATLNVTGTGAGVWTKTGGTLNANTSGTVAFTGAAPEIAGSSTTTFRNLLIKSTTSATVTANIGVNAALIVEAGGQVDITALPGSSLTLGSGASLTNSGTVKGGIVTSATGKVFAGTDGGYATGTINPGDLTLTTGSTVNLDVNSLSSSANDKLVVGGTLTLNNTVFNLKAPGDGAAIDSAVDYTLVTAGSISGTPVLNWVAGFVPVNVGDYSLVVSGGTIKLHAVGGLPATAPSLVPVLSGNQLTLSWDDASFTGYSVQVQTNSAGLTTSWTDTGITVSPFVTTIDPANPSVFFRLAKP